MKKLTTIVALLFAITAFGQKDQIPDSVEFISKRHIELARQRLFKQLETLEPTMNAAKYNGLVDGINAALGELINVATEDYSKKKKPVK